MQKRHKDRSIYFNELANTSRDYYIDYLKKYIPVTSGTSILEIGCGEGGNLLPFSEMGCNVTGIDISGERIRQAEQFFTRQNRKAVFIARDFFEMEEPKEEKKFDIILLHDIIEHIYGKEKFIMHLKMFLNHTGVIFFGFPAWQMPFGGHQQICKNRFCSVLPFIHLLPASLYKSLLVMFGEDEHCIDELLDIKKCKCTIEKFERLLKNNKLDIIDRTLWFINPHYKQKFNLHPRKLNRMMAGIRYIRGFFSTSCFYIAKLS